MTKIQFVQTLFQSINVQECVYLMESLIFCWMRSMYQLLSVWNMLFYSLPINHQRPRPKDGSWKRSTFFFFFFLQSCLQIIVPPVVYIVAFFCCCRHPFPFPPSFLLIPSQVVQWRPSSHDWGLIGLVQIVCVTSCRCRWWHTATGWSGQPDVSAGAVWGQAVIGQRGWESPGDSCFKWGSPREKTHSAGVVAHVS